jgi:hypothetical protein
MYSIGNNTLNYILEESEDWFVNPILMIKKKFANKFKIKYSKKALKFSLSKKYLDIIDIQFNKKRRYGVINRLFTIYPIENEREKISFIWILTTEENKKYIYNADLVGFILYRLGKSFNDVILSINERGLLIFKYQDEDVAALMPHDDNP